MPYDIFNIGIDWAKQPKQTLEPYRTIIQYPGSGIYIRDISDEIQIKFSAEYTNLSKSAENQILSYFKTHNGRLNAFWIPVPKNYFTATANIGAGNTTISIQDVSPIWLRGYERMFIIGPDLTLYHAKITGLTSTTMSIDAPLGVALTMGQILLFGKLIYCRFDQDEISMQYSSDSVSECELSFIELPKEYPLS
jgi:hypothetical protein